MANVFIIHGSYGFPGENWFPWLRRELEKLGHRVYIPAFPTPEGQNLKKWLDVFNPYVPELDSNTILIGHSNGAIFLLRLLEKINVKIKAVFLVAGPVKLLNSEIDPILASFVDRPLNWEKIRSNADHFYPIYSEDDPFVPVEHGRITAENLRAELILVKNAGHFNAKAGYIRFDLILGLVRKELQAGQKI